MRHFGGVHNVFMNAPSPQHDSRWVHHLMTFWREIQNQLKILFEKDFFLFKKNFTPEYKSYSICFLGHLGGKVAGDISTTIFLHPMTFWRVIWKLKYCRYATVHMRLPSQARRIIDELNGRHHIKLEQVGDWLTDWPAVLTDWLVSSIT